MSTLNFMVMLAYSVLDLKYPFWANLPQKINQNFVATLIRITVFWWWYSPFLFKTGNTLFGQSWSINSNLFAYGKIWYPDYFRYAEFDDNIRFLFFTGTNFFEKVAPDYQSYYIPLFKLFNVSISSFCFGKLVKRNSGKCFSSEELLVNKQ